MIYGVALCCIVHLYRSFPVRFCECCIVSSFVYALYTFSLLLITKFNKK